MKHVTSIGLALLVAASALALPLPIQNGVLTGSLNANGQAVTNVGALTFADGTTQSTAGGGGAVAPGFSGTVTNLTQTVVTTLGPNLMTPGATYSGTPCGLNGVQFNLQANTSYLVILGANELGPPWSPGDPIYPGVYLLDGNCISQGQLSATNVWNISSVQNPYTVGFGSYNFYGLVTFTIQQITTNVVQSFNITTYTNGVAQTNTGMAAYNPPPAPAGGGGNVMYGGPMMFDLVYGCTNILSDGWGDLLIQDGGSIYVNQSDTLGFAYATDGQCTTIGSGSIMCQDGTGYQGSLTDNSSSQGAVGAVPVANGDGTWTWGGGNCFYAPGCGGPGASIYEYGAYSVFSPGCGSITDYNGNSFFGPSCSGVLDNSGFCFFGPGCNSMSANGADSFFGPGCNQMADAGNSFYTTVCANITENSGYSFFGPGCDGIVDYGGRCSFGPGGENITTYGGWDSFGPGCSGISEFGGYSFYAGDDTAIYDGSANGNFFLSPGCGGINEYGNGDSFFGPGCNTITDNGGYSLFGPGCNNLNAYASECIFGPGCNAIADTSGGGSSFYGPGCSTIIENGFGFAMYGPNCIGITDSGMNSFFGPGCNNLTNSSGYCAYFGSGGSVAGSVGVLVIGDDATLINLTNETSLVVADSYQLGLAHNKVRLKTDGAHIIPTVPVALTNGIVTVEGTVFYPHTVSGALVWTTNSAHD